AGECGFKRPAWLDEALHDRKRSPRRFRNAQVVDRYLEGTRRYIHLLDGGIADNLGLRGPLDNVVLVGGLRRRFDQLGGLRPRHIAVIVVTRRCIPSRRSAWFPRRPRSPRSSTQSPTWGSTTTTSRRSSSCARA